MKIIELKSENIKRVKAVEIIPKDNVVIISGKNDQGKTSILDSIWYALEGKASLKDTPMPIRKGEMKAEVKLTLDDFMVTRNWTANDKSYLKVTNREGLVYGSPQELLDSFIGRLAFDPLEFAQMKEKDQRDLLLKLVNVDIDSFDSKIETLREYRRLQGQTVKLYEGERDERNFSDVPDKEISITELQAELEKAIDHNRDIDEAQHKISRLESSIENSEMNILELEKEIKDFKKSIETEKTLLNREREFVEKEKKVDIEYIRKSMNASLAINELVQAKKRNIGADNKRDTAQAVYDDYTEKIALQLKGKDTALRLAKMPIAGLSINDIGVIYNDIPFGQLSSSEQLKVSLAIAIALNPKLKVIRIVDGSLLDEDNMELIKGIAKEKDYQIWIERVNDTGELCFIIEDGELVDKKG